MDAALKERLEKINLIAILDHSGRAGNNFVLTLFDSHPEIIACNWVHYVYSYLLTRFGPDDPLDSREAGRFIMEESYFRYVFNEPNEKLAAEMIRFGADPDSPLDRTRARRFFTERILAVPLVRRRDLITGAYLAFLYGRGMDPDRARYIMVADAVSLRDENVLQGFSGRVMDLMVQDFPNAKLISLVRDPRANFASNRHQFVNSQGNMHGIHLGNLFETLHDLSARRLTMGRGTVFLFWLCFFAATSRTIYGKKRQYADHFLTLRNEDINLDFVATMRRFCDWLGVSFLKEWEKPNYAPTSVGRPWRGTGAYNSRYQTHLDGPLPNDPQEVADRVTGPNRYVTERWKQRMSRREIEIVELLFREEMQDCGYRFQYPRSGGVPSLGRLLLGPFEGELPAPSWILRGWKRGLREVLDRLFYSIAFPAPALLSRLLLLQLHREGFFDNVLSVSPLSLHR